eukprot:1196128-Prorocentrum_minimum.AAC.3
MSPALSPTISPAISPAMSPAISNNRATNLSNNHFRVGFVDRSKVMYPVCYDDRKICVRIRN